MFELIERLNVFIGRVAAKIAQKGLSLAIKLAQRPDKQRIDR